MGFFESKHEAKKQEKTIQPSYRPESTPAPKQGSFTGTLIGSTMKVDGDLNGKEDVLVEGTVTGKLTTRESVIVGQRGTVRATIRCKGLTVRGEVFGNVETTDRVVIESTGKLRGDISTSSLTIEPGGFFEGFSKMLNRKPDLKEKKEEGQQGQKPNQEKENNQGKSSQK